jgi:hypothetical protein
MTRPPLSVAIWMLAAMLAPAARADDGMARDPTAWPPALRSAMAAAAAASAASGAQPAEDAAIRQVVIAGGKAFVVQRGRRYAVGEQLDGARIERITEQAVWLREAGQVRRESLYGGVEKRSPPAVVPAAAPPAASGAKKSKEKP